MNGIKPIVLKARSNSPVGVVRLTPEAEKVVRRLHTRSGIPISQIVSEIITQSESLVEIDSSELDAEELRDV